MELNLYYIVLVFLFIVIFNGIVYYLIVMKLVTKCDILSEEMC